MLQGKIPHDAMKIPCAMTKIRGSQINKYFKERRDGMFIIPATAFGFGEMTRKNA